MHNFKQGKSQKGITLIELMIALVLGLVVISGVLTGMGALSRSSNTQINNNDLQETGNTALSYITFQLRSALASPCEKFSNTTSSGGFSVTLPTLSTQEKKYTDIDSAEKLEKLIRRLGISVKSSNHKVGNKMLHSDNLTFFGTKNRFFDLTPDATTLDANGYYVVTDCLQMDIVKGDQVEDKAKNSGMDIVAPLTASVISVSKNGDAGKSRNALFSRELFADRGERLMNNVEAIRVFFGVDSFRFDETTGRYATGTDGVVDTFKTYSEIQADIAGGKDTYKLVSAEIYVLVRADKPDYSSPSSYTVYLPNTAKEMSKINEGSQITFTDSVPRRVFTRSVNMRNMAKIW